MLLAADVCATIASAAAAESPLWAAALLPPGEREADVVFSPVGDPAYALGIETIYEGYLLHYGRPRLFTPSTRERALLLGDYLYAHGLVHVAAAGSVEAVADLAELISICAQLRAERHDSDGWAWAATVSLLGEAGGDLEGGRAALRDDGDHRALVALARRSAPAAELEQALAAHAHRVR